MVRKQANPNGGTLLKKSEFIKIFMYIGIFMLTLLTYFVYDSSTFEVALKILKRSIVLEIKGCCFLLKGLDGWNAGLSQVLCLQLTTPGTQFILRRQMSS